MDWKPIETVPKDGTPVLLWVDYSHPALQGRYAPEAVVAKWCWPGGKPSPNGYWALVQTGAYAEDDDVSGEPTHWHSIEGPR